MKFSLPNIYAFFETIDAWIVRHPRPACVLGWCVGMVLGNLL